MKKFYPIFKYVLLLSFLWFRVNAEDKKPVRENPNPVNLKNAQTTLSEEEMRELNKAIEKLNLGQVAQALVVDNMEDIPLEVSSATEDNRAQARKLMSYLDNNPDKLTTSLSFESLMTLPVGVKKTLSDNSEVTIGVYSVTFDNNQGADATIFCRMTTQVETASGGREERDLLFGVSGVRFTKTGGLISNSMKAVLLGDFTIPSKNWTIVLRGAEAIGNPETSETYLQFNCEGFTGAQISADIVFPRNVIVPYDVTTRKGTSGRVTFAASAAISSGFRDLLLTATGGSQTFAVAGFDKFGFSITDLVVDMSDVQNSAGTILPPGYRHPDFGSPLWRGVSLRQLKVYFPKAFENKTGSDINITGLIVDNTGFTGKFSYTDATGIQFKAQKWEYTIKSFNLEFLQNKLVSGGFGGGFYTPINGSPGTSSGFAYSAIISDTTYHFAITADANDVPINAWKAKGKIYQGSTIEMLITNDRFYPSCNLSGELNFASNKVNDDSVDGLYETDPNATVKFDGIVFDNLLIKTSATAPTNLSIGGFKYTNSANTKLANIPVVITRFEKEAASPTGEIWIGIGFKISMLQDKLSGAADVTLRSKYDTETGKLILGGTAANGKKKISLNDIYIEGSGTNFAVAGYVKFIQTGTKKEFAGGLDLAIYKPFAIGVRAEARFGKEIAANYRYGYFSIYLGQPSSDGVNLGTAGAPRELASKTPGTKPVFKPLGTGTTGVGTGVRIPIGIGDLAINGLGLAIYYNMMPTCTNVATGVMTYTPNNTIPFGFKVMLGIQNAALSTSPPSFVGQVAVEMSLSTNSGINSIGVFGKGTFGVKKPGLSLSAGSLVQNTAKLNNVTATVNHTSEGIMSSSKTIPDVKDKDTNPTNPPPSEIRVAIGLLIGSGVVHLEGQVDVNVGTLTGIGPGGRAGNLIMHFEKKNNYFYIGKSPYSERVGLKKGDNFAIGAYLMAGKGLTPFPLPPPEVVSFFPTLRSRINTLNQSGLGNYSIDSTIKGFAIGAYIKASIDINSRLAKVQGTAIGGFDLLVSQGYCPSVPNHWMGQMQLYAMADVRIKVLFIRFNTGIGMYLYGQGPKKFGAAGDFCVKYGRKKKSLCLSFKVGENC